MKFIKKMLFPATVLFFSLLPAILVLTEILFDSSVFLQTNLIQILVFLVITIFLTSLYTRFRYNGYALSILIFCMVLVGIFLEIILFLRRNKTTKYIVSSFPFNSVQAEKIRSSFVPSGTVVLSPVNHGIWNCLNTYYPSSPNTSAYINERAILSNRYNGIYSNQIIPSIVRFSGIVNNFIWVLPPGSHIDINGQISHGFEYI